MTTSQREEPGAKGSRGRKIKRRHVLSVGCLMMVAAPFIASSVMLRLLQPDPAASNRTALDWEEDMGSLAPSEAIPDSLPPAPPLGSFTLPQVLSVQDAVERDSIWVLLDSRSGRLHFVHSAKGWMGSSGRRGQGPGELQDPVAMALSESSLWVLNQRGMALDRFTPEGTFLERRTLRGGGCLAGMAKKLEGREGGGLLLLRVCPGSLPGPGNAWVEDLQSSGELTPLFHLPLGSPGSRRLHLLRQPAMASDGRRIHLGTSDVPCLVDLLSSGAVSGHRCLPDLPRALASSEDREKLKRRFRSLPALGLLPLTIPDSLPWYDRLFAVPGGVVVLRIRAEEVRDLVFLNDQGAAQVMNAPLPPNTYVGNRTILTVEDRLQGSWVQFRPSPWR